MYIFEYRGMPLAHQKIVPGSTATSLDSQCYIYQKFTLLADGVDAGSTEVAKGGWIVGAAGARAIIDDYSLTAGAWGASSARVKLTLRSVSGTFVAAENIAYGANADHLTVRAGETQRLLMDDYTYRGMQAKCALVCVITNTALVDIVGGTPDQTSLIGIPLVASSTIENSIFLKDSNEIMKFKVIDYVAQSASTVQVTYFF
jgi:hypothetical protein